MRPRWIAWAESQRCHTQPILRIKLTKIPFVPIFLLEAMLLFQSSRANFFSIYRWVVVAAITAAVLCSHSIVCHIFTIHLSTTAHTKKWYYETALLRTYMCASVCICVYNSIFFYSSLFFHWICSECASVNIGRKYGREEKNKKKNVCHQNWDLEQYQQMKKTVT